MCAVHGRHWRVSALRERLADARLYLVCDARPEEFLRAAIRGGVDVIQLRDRSLPDDAAIVEAAGSFRRAAEATGVPFVLNDRPDLVADCGADGVHVGQDDTAPARAREAIGPDRLIGLSTHAPDQGASAAEDADVDYLSIGPVHETPTKPGRPAAGIDYVRWAAEHVPDKPWFAIGGIDAATLPAVRAAGARRVVVVRSITEAADPEAAAKELVDGLA